ncbi:helix-turn-helix transcriptional regulator [Pseudomonas sp. P154a]|uniref:helix-turn-helix domain-containing protein n=1 Tax=Pseudomonas mucoides TaxID=2730424 RepID=UPI0018922823|nr:helix-turn-helix transcriptional regulator [Pseudomonas mucoides]MBF6042304.1 helix-turn-helix transcriptional regulator [Pseudomonas mucoides]
MTQKFNCFASEVKALRKKLIMSQENLAAELGVSFATVNRWENGKTQPSKLAKNQFERFCELQKKQGAL